MKLCLNYFFTVFVLSILPTSVGISDPGSADSQAERIEEIQKRNLELMAQAEREIHNAFVLTNIVQDIFGPRGSCKPQNKNTPYTTVANRYVVGGNMGDESHSSRSWALSRIYRDLYRTNTPIDPSNLSSECLLDILDLALYETSYDVEVAMRAGLCPGLEKIDIIENPNGIKNLRNCRDDIKTKAIELSDILREQQKNVNLVNEQMNQRIADGIRAQDGAAAGCLRCDINQLVAAESDQEKAEEIRFALCCGTIKSYYSDKTERDCHNMIKETGEAPNPSICGQSLALSIWTGFSQMNILGGINSESFSAAGEILESFSKDFWGTLYYIGMASVEISSGYSSNLRSCLNYKYNIENICEVIGQSGGAAFGTAIFAQPIKTLRFLNHQRLKVVKKLDDYKTKFNQSKIGKSSLVGHASLLASPLTNLKNKLKTQFLQKYGHHFKRADEVVEVTNSSIKIQDDLADINLQLTAARAAGDAAKVELLTAQQATLTKALSSNSTKFLGYWKSVIFVRIPVILSKSLALQAGNAPNALSERSGLRQEIKVQDNDNK